MKNTNPLYEALMITPSVIKKSTKHLPTATAAQRIALKNAHESATKYKESVRKGLIKDDAPIRSTSRRGKPSSGGIKFSSIFGSSTIG